MIVEMRIYHCLPGRLPALLERFNTTTLGFFEKYGIEQIGFWTTLIGPSNHALTYRVYQRSYTNALVLYKPLSYAQGAPAPGLLGASSATYFSLGGTYKALNADGTLGPAVTGISLRNGEGAIMIKA